jgi:cytochrome c oxidase subunit 4
MTLADHRASRGEPIIREEAAAVSHEHHPTARGYIIVGLVLAAITSAEVALYYIDISRGLLITNLAIMSIAKFAIVVLWFMHLKFDNRLFSYLFLLGLLGAIALFTVVLAISAANVV